MRQEKRMTRTRRRMEGRKVIGYSRTTLMEIRGRLSTSGAEETGNYSFFKEIPLLFALAAFFSFCISFFCLFDLGAAFCTFLCSLFAMIYVPPASIISARTTRAKVTCHSQEVALHSNPHYLAKLLCDYIVPDFFAEEGE